MPSIFRIQNLRVQYRFRLAVDDLSLELMPGQALGLLGANGAGKTSTIRALLGMIRPKTGTVEVFGGKPGTPGVFRRLGFAPEDGVPPEYMNADEYLDFVGRFRVPDKAKRIEIKRQLLDVFELAPKKRIQDYSKGMKRRLVLAQAFLGNPELLILDEPLNGLDPLMIIKLREQMDAYRVSGGTILFSSHILNEVEKTCSDVAVLSDGKLVYQADLLRVQSEYGSVEAAFAARVGAKPHA